MQNNLLSTHHSCAKQLIVHTSQMRKRTYCLHTTAVHNNLFSTHNSCAQQLIVHTPQTCKTTYCPHTTAVQNNLLSTHYRNLFSTVIAVNKFVDASLCLSFAQLLHSTRIHTKLIAHVFSPDKIIRLSDSVIRHEGIAVSPRVSLIFPVEVSGRFITYSL